MKEDQRIRNKANMYESSEPIREEPDEEDEEVEKKRESEHKVKTSES